LDRLNGVATYKSGKASYNAEVPTYFQKENPCGVVAFSKASYNATVVGRSDCTDTINNVIGWSFSGTYAHDDAGDRLPNNMVSLMSYFTQPFANVANALTTAGYVQRGRSFVLLYPNQKVQYSIIPSFKTLLDECQNNIGVIRIHTASQFGYDPDTCEYYQLASEVIKLTYNTSHYNEALPAYNAALTNLDFGALGNIRNGDPINTVVTDWNAGVDALANWVIPDV
jgi:hypothetical protein